MTPSTYSTAGVEGYRCTRLLSMTGTKSEVSLWTRDQPDAETPTWQQPTLTTESHPCPLRDSNPQS